MNRNKQKPRQSMFTFPGPAPSCLHRSLKSFQKSANIPVPAPRAELRGEATADLWPALAGEPNSPYSPCEGREARSYTRPPGFRFRRDVAGAQQTAASDSRWEPEVSWEPAVRKERFL